MSFPKAKIHRFNEEMTCAPPPGKYDPKFPDTKIIGPVIEKSKRFHEKKLDTCGSTESLDSVCSRCSCMNHQPQQPPVVFRTPQMPKKRVIATPKSAVETSRQLRRTPNAQSKSKKKLNDVFMQDKENTNPQKGDFEKEHAYIMLGKDQEMASLLNEISELKSTMVKMENTNDFVLNSLKSEFETSFNSLSMELEQSKNDLEKEREVHQKNLDEFRGQIKILEENIKNCNSMNNDLEYQLTEKQSALIEMTNKHSEVETELKKVKESIEKLLSDHAADIKAIKDRCSEELEGLATAAELNVDLLSRKMEDRLKVFKREVEIERQESQLEFTCKLEELSDIVKEKAKLFDSQVADMFSKLKLMEEDFDKRACELISSLNVCSEWNEEKLNEHVKTLEELEAQKAANIEQKIIIVELQEKVELLEDEISKFKRQCKKYEVIQNEASKTIQVLSQRLFESESEVEKQNEIRKEMKLRSNALEEKIRSLVHENNQLTSNLNDIRTAIVKEVKEVETVLLGKVENYRKKAAEETQKFRLAIEERQNQIELMVQELEFYRSKAVETAEYISLCQSRIKSYKEEVKEMTMKQNDLEMRHNEKMNEQKKQYAILSDKYEKLQNELKFVKEKYKNELENILAEKQNLERANNEKKEALKNLELRLEETKLNLCKAEKNVGTLEETVYEHERHIEELALKLDHYTECAQKTAQQINLLTQTKSELEGEIKKMEEAATEKDLRIESLSSELNESKSYVQSVTEHFVTLMNDLNEKDRKCEALLQEMEIKNVNMIQVSEEYERMKNLYEGEASRAGDLEKDIKDIQADNEKYVDELISELVLEKERCSELSQALEEIKIQKKDVEKKIAELEEQSKGKDEFQNKIKVLESNLEDTKMENVDLNNEVEALYKEIEELEKQIEDLKVDKKKMTVLVNELKGEKGDLMEMIKQQQEEMELLTNEISRQQEQIDELKQMKNEKLDEMKAQFQAEVQNELYMLQQHLEEKQKMVTQLQAKEQDLVYKLKAAEADLIAGETEKKNVECKLKENAEKMNDFLIKYNAMEKRKNEYKIYVIDLEKELLSLKEQVDALNDEKEKLKEQSNEETMKATSLTATIADLECRNRELESIIGPFKEQLLQYESERAELLTKTATTEKELRSLELAHAKVLGHQNHRQKIRHVVHLTEQITELKSELEKLRAENTKLRVAALEAQKEASLRSRRKDKENSDVSPAKTTKPTNKVSRQSSPALKERTNAH